MEIKRFGSNGRYSSAVIHDHVLYLCGQTCDEDILDVKFQTQVVLKQIDDLLESHGSDKENILSATIYLKNIKDYNAMNEIWDSWITKGREPARACVEAKLADESILVEISIIAAVK
jgi:enamine deaminase RidA (YjgF/YER057c/UK114 family)